MVKEMLEGLGLNLDSFYEEEINYNSSSVLKWYWSLDRKEICLVVLSYIWRLH